MEIKRGLKKGITKILIGELCLLPLTGISQSEYTKNLDKDKNTKDNYEIVVGRAIVSPKNNFDHKSYAKVRFVNNELNKDTTFHANHMGVIKYKIPVDLNKKNTKYNLFISQGYDNHKLGGNEKGEDFIPYKTTFVVGGSNGLDILREENTLEKKVSDTK